MSTLRKEIKSIVSCNSRNLKNEEDWKVTNEIISKIEKRIDSIRIPPNFLEHEMEYAVGFGEAITKVKEMLK